ncbi:DoxX family protein [Castellaniella sp.]|uniref:DoxX family protein n=1 Tax=Castellaniella sp. TaxID=1955812 RepID=UPI002AFF47CC|nr:DoxX family protein [Castellaniella sp.]
MSSTSTDDLGKLVLRLSLGILILLHGLSKLGGVDWISGMLQSHGLPGFIAYGVYIGEILAPVLLIIGIWARIGALVVAINMLFVIGLVHMNELFTLGKSGAWALELQGMFLFGAIAVALLGAGGYSLGGRNGRYN